MKGDILLGILLIVFVTFTLLLLGVALYQSDIDTKENAKVCHNMSGIYSEGKCELIK